MAVYSMMFMGMAPFGALLAGVLANHLGAPLTVAIGGAACVLAAGGFALRLPVLRAAAQPLILAHEMAAGHPPQEMTGNRLAQLEANAES
jgi:hypothetical protein